MTEPLFPLVELGPFWTVGERDPEVDERTFPDWSWFILEAHYHRTPEEAERERQVLAAQSDGDLVVVGPWPCLWRARCLACGQTVGDPDRRYESWDWVRDVVSQFGRGNWLVDDQRQLLWHNRCAPAGDGFRFGLTEDDLSWLAGIGTGIADAPPVQAGASWPVARVLQAAASGVLTGPNFDVLTDWEQLQRPVSIGGRKVTGAEATAISELRDSGHLAWVGTRITATAKGRQQLAAWAQRTFTPRRKGGR